MSASLDPGRLARLLEDAVGTVGPRADALALILRGARRRRAMHRAVAAVTALVIVAGGAIAYAAVRGGAPQPGGPANGITSKPGPSASPTSSAVRRARGDWDIDGDGRPDSARIVPLGKGDRSTRFLLVVTMTSLGTQRIPFTAASPIQLPPKGPRIAGSVDADASGRAEIFVMVAAGASTQFWTIFKLVHRRITQVTTAGKPVRIPVGGSVEDNFGFSCRPHRDELVTYSYGALTYTTKSQKWALQRSTYRWKGSRLMLVSTRTRTMGASSASPRLARYAGVRCGDLPQYAAY